MCNESRSPLLRPAMLDATIQPTPYRTGSMLKVWLMSQVNKLIVATICQLCDRTTTDNRVSIPTRLQTFTHGQ